MLLIVAAAALRRALIPWIGTVVPHNVTFVALVIATARFGIGPGLVALVVGNVAVETLVLGTHLTGFDSSVASRMGVTFIAGVFFCFVLHALRVAGVKAQSKTKAVEDALETSQQAKEALRDNREWLRVTLTSI